MAVHGYALDPGFKGLLASVGVRFEDVLRRAGLPEDLLHRSGVRLPTDQFFAFTQAIEDSVDDPLFALRFVDRVSPEWFSPPLFASLCSPNLTVAASRLARFKPLIAPVELLIESGPDGLRISYRWLESHIGPPPFLSGSEALFLVKLARLGTRHPVRATDVTLRALPAKRAAYEEFLGCRIRRDDRLSVSFAPDDATRPFLTANGEMWDIFEPQLRRRLSELDAAATFGARTRGVLLEALPSGQATVEFAAQRLAVSRRTLQRRLRAEGTSFNAIVRETRESLSQHYLGNTTLSYTEIAYLLGFQEPNSFFRAFNDWTGTTPEARRQALQPGA